MLVNIEFKDSAMRDAFTSGLRDMRYSRYEIHTSDNVVSFMYGTPRSLQPYTRTKEIEAIVQWNNKNMCDLYNDLTKDLKTAPQRIRSLRKNEKELVQKVSELGKSKKTYDIYKTLKPYLGK